MSLDDLTQTMVGRGTVLEYIVNRTRECGTPCLKHWNVKRDLFG